MEYIEQNKFLQIYGNIDGLSILNHLSITIKLTDKYWLEIDMNDLLIFYSIKRHFKFD